MGSEDTRRWVVAVVVAIALVLFVALARGEPDRSPRGATLTVTSQQQL